MESSEVSLTQPMTKEAILTRWPPRRELHPPLAPDGTTPEGAKEFMVSRTEANQIVFAIDASIFEINTGRPLPPVSETPQSELVPPAQ